MQKEINNKFINQDNLCNYKISIIIPTFNRATLLKRSLESIILQDYNNWEIIIIDNYSSDNTINVINNFSNNNIIYKKFKNFGIIAKSRNEAVKLASGDFIAFLDSDDWWTPRKLSKCIDQFRKDRNCSIVYHNCIITDGKKNRSSNCRNLNEKTYDDLICNGNTLITSSVMLKRKIFNEIKLFNDNEEYLGWEDYDLWLRIAKANFKFRLIKENLGFYWNDSSGFDNPERILLNLKLINKNILTSYKRKNTDANIWWPSYTAAIAFTKQGKRKEALSSFINVIYIKAPLIYKIKSIYYILFKVWYEN